LSYLAQCPKILPEIYVKVKHFDVFIIFLWIYQENHLFRRKIISNQGARSPPPREGDSRGWVFFQMSAILFSA